MVDPWQMALDAQFRAPGSAAAIYTPVGGAPGAIRVIREQGTDERGNLVLDTNVARIRRSEVAEPDDGGSLVIGADAFTLQGAARLDAEGLTWTCDLQPA